MLIKQGENRQINVCISAIQKIIIFLCLISKNIISPETSHPISNHNIDESTSSRDSDTESSCSNYPYRYVTFCCIHWNFFSARYKQKRHSSSWHEALAGRTGGIIASPIHVYLSSFRDVMKLTFWLDNSATQNKN